MSYSDPLLELARSEMVVPPARRQRTTGGDLAKASGALADAATALGASLRGAAAGAVTLGVVGLGVGALLSYGETGKVRGGAVGKSGLIGAAIGAVAGAIL